MEAILKYRRPHADGHGPEVVDVVCPACSDTRTRYYGTWTVFKCSNCGQELQHPAEELPTLSAGESLAVKVRVIRNLMQNDHRSMTEPNQPGPISYADRLESLARVLSQAIEEFDESQPKPF